jgi:hypothetical protein
MTLCSLVQSYQANILKEHAAFSFRVEEAMLKVETTNSTKLHGQSPRANYTDQATAACQRS